MVVVAVQLRGKKSLSSALPLLEDAPSELLPPPDGDIAEDCADGFTYNMFVAGRYSRNLVTGHGLIDFIRTGTV